jgi:UDPglucose 6-dehydrogenase
VPVGTAERVTRVITEEFVNRGFDADPARRRALKQPDFSVVSNPEFLKEGAALDDFMRPDRIVIGVAEGDEAGKQAKNLMHKLYMPFNRNHERTVFMDVRSAEFTKYAANSMLATRISFMNELANLADKLGADIELVRQGIGSDPRIGYSFLYAGTGYGGSCFPKDLQALCHAAAEHGERLQVLEAVEAVNRKQKSVLVRKITARFGEDLSGRRFALWGLAFKPNTDDMREAPSRTIIRHLVRRGATIYAYDPVAKDEARRCLEKDFADDPRQLAAITFGDFPMDVLQDADALIIATEWKAFRSPDFAAVKAALRQPVIFDGRNLYEPAEMNEAGFEYQGVGRSSNKLKD